MNKVYTWIVSLVVLFLLGLGLGYKLYSGKVTVVEKDRPAIYLHDTSIVIERKTDTVLVNRLAPVGGTTVIHDGSIDIKPTATDTLIDTFRLAGDTVMIVKTVGFDVVNLTYAILQEKDGGIRLQIKVKNGEVIGAIDVPRNALKFNKPLKNMLGVYSYYVPQESVISLGAIYNRNIGCFNLGGSIGTRYNDWGNISVGVHTGISF